MILYVTITTGVERCQVNQLEDGKSLSKDDNAIICINQDSAVLCPAPDANATPGIRIPGSSFDIVIERHSNDEQFATKLERAEFIMQLYNELPEGFGLL